AGNDFFKLIFPRAFFEVHDAYFKMLLTRPNAKIRIAALSDDPDVVVGWSLMEPSKLHYVWVAEGSRQTKVCSALIPDEFDTVTHLTKFFLPIWNCKYPTVKFNPYA